MNIPIKLWGFNFNIRSRVCLSPTLPVASDDPGGDHSPILVPHRWRLLSLPLAFTMPKRKLIGKDDSYVYDTRPIGHGSFALVYAGEQEVSWQTDMRNTGSIDSSFAFRVIIGR